MFSSYFTHDNFFLLPEELTHFLPLRRDHAEVAGRWDFHLLSMSGRIYCHDIKATEISLRSDH